MKLTILEIPSQCLYAHFYPFLLYVDNSYKFALGPLFFILSFDRVYILAQLQELSSVFVVEKELVFRKIWLILGIKDESLDGDTQTYRQTHVHIYIHTQNIIRFLVYRTKRKLRELGE